MRVANSARSLNFESSAEELHAIGHLLGPDRAQGASPRGHGTDETVAVSLLLRIAGELTGAFLTLTNAGRHYGAAALLRQLVEVEYLAWAFETHDSEAERWLRSTQEERQKFFTPAKLRRAANGEFRQKDYSYHCEMGGHPVPDSSRMLSGYEPIVELMLADLLGHAGRIWDHIARWASATDHGAPVLSRRKAMATRFVPWKDADPLASLPPPP